MLSLAHSLLMMVGRGMHFVKAMCREARSRAGKLEIEATGLNVSMFEGDRAEIFEVRCVMACRSARRHKV